MRNRCDPLFELEQATIARAGGTIALRDVHWRICERETWAITGPVGAGKTTLGEMILGRHHLVSGSIRWPLVSRLRAAGRPIAYPSEVIRLVTFRDDSRLFSPAKHYYQQRFNFIEPADDVTLGQFLRSARDDGESMHRIAKQFEIEPFLELSFLKLSHGQSRRARLAQALLAQPELLILDDPFLGLDAKGREDLARMLGESLRQGIRLVLIMSRPPLPNWITHVLELDAGAVKRQMLRAQCRDASAATTEFTCDRDRNQSDTGAGEPVIEVENVCVSYAGKPILDKISWTVRAGEKWAVLGPNGAGKSTLLSLLCGDHPQAYSNKIGLFGRQRGTGESIWDIKRNVGFVSPELHVYFTEPLTAEHAAATGFFDSLTPRPTTARQDATIRELLAAFGIGALAQSQFAQLSMGQQRLVLLARALVKQPPLLILDEPFQGLDETTMRAMRDWLDAKLLPAQTLLFVTHHAEEIPRCVTKRLVLTEPRLRFGL